MPSPINNDWPNWDHEIGELVEPEVETRARLLSTTVEATLKAREARQRGRARLAVLAVLSLVVLLYTHHALTAPRVDRAWMGESLKAQVARGGQPR